MALRGIDRSLGLPVRQQIRAALVHDIVSGAMPPGQPLPSVRDLAERLGVAPATISKVYADLKDSGLATAQVGSGTFVAESTLARAGARQEIDAILAKVDALVDRATSAGMTAADVVSMLNARAIHRVASGPKPTVVVVGLFADATRSYAERVAHQAGEAAYVSQVVLGTGPGSLEPDVIARMRSADLIVTFADLVENIEAIAPDTHIVAIRFIPAETTRMALASLDPMARVAVVSRFASFLPVLELGVRRFAPHVEHFTAMDINAPELADAVAQCDVVVMSTGAEAAGDMAPEEAIRIEYRHVPDPGDVARLVLPHLPPVTRPTPDSAATGGRKEAS